jgi:hypothetical protein
VGELVGQEVNVSTGNHGRGRGEIHGIAPALLRPAVEHVSWLYYVSVGIEDSERVSHGSFQLLCLLAAGSQATVDGQHGAADVTRLIGRQKHGGITHFTGTAKSLHRHVGADLGA